jgi:hypothetical protein
MTLTRRLLAGLLAACMATSALAQPSLGTSATASISTEQAALTLQATSGGHERLHAALDRADLAAALQARGVSVDELRARVNALTDAEATALLAQIDSAPAGADIVGVLFTVFIILLITDILGLTKVFPFTKPVR